MKLYEQTECWAKIHQALIESEGEITPEIQELMNAAPWVNIQEKVNAICRIIRMEESFKKQCDEEIARLQSLASTRARTVNGLKAYLLINLQTLNRKDVDTGIFKVWRQNSPAALSITDETKIPTEYFRGKLDLSSEQFDLIPDELKSSIVKFVNNAAVKEAVKSGIEIDGAELTQSEHIRIK